MQFLNFSFTLENIRNIIVTFLDIFIMWLILYYVLRIVRNNSRTIQIFKGIVFVILADSIAKLLGLKTIEYVTDMFINWGFLAVIIIFQPEIRSLLEKMGKSGVFSRITTLTGNEKENLVDQIVTAVMLLSQDQTGALISIEQSHSLEDYVSTGTRLNSDVSAELLTSIFVTSTPLHDGAVIIQGDKIACASAYFPPTNLELPSRFGARHRAAIGISEITDAVTIVVSEETGAVSIAQSGKIFQVDRRQLRNFLMRIIIGEVTELRSGSLREAAARKPRPASETGEVPVRKEAKVSPQKIEIEEIKPAASDEKILIPPKKEEETPKPAEPVRKTRRRRKLSIFPKDSNIVTEEEKMQELDQEASDIKLPHKKKRAKPSYPEHAETQTPAAETARPAAPSAPLPRMSAEEVEKMRQEQIRRLSHEVKKEQEEKREEDISRFDTSRIDISGIVGFSNELDSQFEMIDNLDVPSDNGNSAGGDA